MLSYNATNDGHVAVVLPPLAVGSFAARSNIPNLRSLLCILHSNTLAYAAGLATTYMD